MRFASTLCLLLLFFASSATDVSFAQNQSRNQKQNKNANTGPNIVWVNDGPGNNKTPMPEFVSHHTFQSKAAGTDVGYCLYLPPGYDAAADRRYPVIYNLHGNGGNEFHSFEDVTLLHEGILAGKWPPMIVVLPNGGKSTFYKDSYDGKFPIETMFIKELIPHIDATYRTIANRSGRCIEGFSMGGRGSTRLAMKYPEMFCSLFCQAGNVPRIAEGFDPSTPHEYPNSYLGPDKANYEANDAYLLAEKNLKEVKQLRIMIACGTKDGGHLPTIRDFHQHLVELNVDHTYLELESLGHQRTKMIEQLRDNWFNYHVESLRLAALSNAR